MKTFDDDLRDRLAIAGVEVRTTPDMVHRINLGGGDMIAIGWEPWHENPEMPWWDATLYSEGSETKFFEGTDMDALVALIEKAATPGR